MSQFVRLSTLRQGAMAALFSALLLCPCVVEAAEPLKNKNQTEEVSELPTVVVTAQKREENVQDIPMSVSVVTGDQIEDRGAKDTEELMRYIPNVFVKDGGNYHQTMIRGVGGFSTSLSSPVGLYVDDVNYPNSFMQNPELFDVERVEVLKGPQGTLYGRNSESGVINIVTRQPDNEMRGKIFTEFSGYDTNHGWSSGTKLGTALSGPIKEDTLYMGVAGKWDYSGGFVNNKFNDDDEATSLNDFNGRGILRWTPDSHWDVRFTLDGSHNDDGMGFGRYITGPNQTGYHTINSDESPYRLRRSDGETLHVKYESDDIVFTSITGRRFFTDNYGIDMDMTPTSASAFNGDYKSDDQLLSQEFRLASAPGTGPLEWLAGVYAHKEDLNLSALYDMPAFGMYQKRDTDIDIQGAAVFGQATYTLFDRLHLTGGLRYDYIDQRADQIYHSTMFGVTHSEYSANYNGGELLPKASIAYDVNDNIVTYATVAKGYLAGGYDYLSATSSEALQYDPEYTMNYEVGTKTTWFDNKLSLNLALFYIDMEDKQVAVSTDASGNVVIGNAGSAHSQGFEIELQARPYHGWELFGGFGYTKTEVDSWSGTTLAGAFDYSGNELSYAPEFTYNVGAQYTHDTGFFGRVELLGTGQFYHDAANAIREDGYELVNTRVGYEDETYEVSLWCKNLFDTRYHDVQFASGTTIAAFDGAPREIGVTVAYKF